MSQQDWLIQELEIEFSASKMIFPKISCSWKLLYLAMSGSDSGFSGGFLPPKWLLLAIQLLHRMHVLSSPNLDILSLSYITTISKDHSDFSGIVWRADKRKIHACVCVCARVRIVVWLFGGCVYVHTRAWLYDYLV